MGFVIYTLVVAVAAVVAGFLNDRRRPRLGQASPGLTLAAAASILAAVLTGNLLLAVAGAFCILLGLALGVVFIIGSWRGRDQPAT